MNYNPSLDGIRALAALVVVAFHAKVPGFGGGFLGVDIFFVLSGFLITQLLCAEYAQRARINWGVFAARRLRRLYPAMATMLIAYLAFAPALFPHISQEKHLQDLLLTALYLSDYARAFDGPLSVLSHTWSLAVEMQFYLVWPVVVVGLLRLPRRTAILALLGLYIASNAWRWVAFEIFEDGWDVYDRADTHASGLVLGSLLGYAQPRVAARWAPVGLAMIAISVMVFEWGEAVTVHFGFTAAEIGTALLVLSAPSWLGIGVLAWLGRMSYGLYLWHYPLMRWMRGEQWGWPETFATGLALGLMAAVTSYYTFERYFRSRRPAVSAHTQPA